MKSQSNPIEKKESIHPLKQEGGTMKKLILGISVLGLFLCLAETAIAQTSTIPYEGRLTAATGARLSDDTATVTFSIYDAPSGGSLLWGPETHDAVSLDNGVFNVQLGTFVTLSPGLFVGSDRYLEIDVRGEVLSPRQPIASVPYALHAVNGPGVSNSTGGGISLNAGNIVYVVDSVDITIPGPGYVAVICGGYLNLDHVIGVSTSIYNGSSKTRGSLFVESGISVARVPGVIETSGPWAFPLVSTKLYQEAAAGTYRYYHHVRKEQGSSNSSNFNATYIRAVYFPSLYGTASLANTPAGVPSDVTQILTDEASSLSPGTSVATELAKLRDEVETLKQELEAQKSRQPNDEN